jgi:hypothetical protein
MSRVPPFSWFANLRWQRLRGVPPTDFGDMGTAFGLDASMDRDPPTTVPAFFMRNGRPTNGAPAMDLQEVDVRSGGDQEGGAATERRVSPVDLREGHHIDRRSRL